MSAVRIGSLDLDITKSGGVYVVSGKDAATLHDKMQKLPDEALDLVVGEMRGDGTFTLKKLPGEERPQGA